MLHDDGTELKFNPCHDPLTGSSPCTGRTGTCSRPSSTRLVEGFSVVRKKLGEERYAQLLDLAARAKALFAADHDDTNGKTDGGSALLFEMQDVLGEVRRGRVKAKLPDEDGEVTGD